MNKAVRYLAIAAMVTGAGVLAVSAATEDKPWKAWFPSSTGIKADTVKVSFGKGEKKKTKELPVSWVLLKKGDKTEKIGVIANSKDFASNIKGYNGPIHVEIGMDMTATIKGLRVVWHMEDKAYGDKVFTGGSLTQFIGMDWRGRYKLGKDVDGVTGATVTSRALAKSIGYTVKRTAKYVLGVYKKKKKSR